MSESLLVSRRWFLRAAPLLPVAAKAIVDAAVIAATTISSGRRAMVRLYSADAIGVATQRYVRANAPLFIDGIFSPDPLMVFLPPTKMPNPQPRRVTQIFEYPEVV